MPLIQIKSLPFDPPVNIGQVLQGVANDFSQGSGVALEHISVTWDVLSSNHYCAAGVLAESQPQNSHPVLVELLTPDFHAPEMVETMLRCLSQSISAQASIPLNNLFITHHKARSGAVFDMGEIVKCG